MKRHLHGSVAVPKSSSNNKLNAHSREEIKLLCVDNLLASSDEVIYFKDAESRFVMVSEGWLARVAPGVGLEDVIGKTDFDFFSRRHAKPAFLDEQRIVATGESLVAHLEREVYPSRPDVWVSSTKVPLRDARGEIVGTFGISRDVTAQVEAEQERDRVNAQLAIARDEALEASNLKSAFLANVSHEIRTPMNGVIGMTELVLDTELTGDQREAIEQIARSGDQMLAILNDVLDLSKIEAGKFELDIADFDLHEVMNATCAIASAQARAKDLAFELCIGKRVPRHVRGDGRRLGQLVLNLATNAVKFTAHGSVMVNVNAKRAGASRSLIRIEVTDSGIGMEPRFVDHLFEPFTQADVSTTRNYGGTGLGLAISRELIELMGGTISVASKPGEGSTFRAELELDDEGAGAGADEQRRVNGPAPRWSSEPLVLVAEDNPVNQLVVARALEHIGCRCDVVADGYQALEAIQREHYDAVLMDCQMPNLDGLQATQAIRRLDGASARVPVIAMTARAMDDDRARCLAAGMDDYVSKPMRRAALAEMMHRWIPATPRDAGVATSSARNPTLSVCHQ
jgi:PAS domain S-box-containing protein